jgi:hypothetical protein
VVPSAIAAIMAARCEMDLSPGNSILPRILLAEAIFIDRILTEIA